MPKPILMDMFHVSVFVPRGLSRAEHRAIRRTLGGRRFRAVLRSAVASAFRRYPSLKPVRFTVSC